MDYTVQGILQVRILEWVAHSLLQGIFPTQGSPALQVDSLPAEPPGKPKNTGVGSLSLLQRIFPTQESNWGILHSRQILYQLSCQGIPTILKWVAIPSFRGSSQPKDQTQLSHIAGSLGGIISWSLPKAASPPTTNQLSLSIYYVKGVQRWILKIRTESPLIFAAPHYHENDRELSHQGSPRFFF